MLAVATAGVVWPNPPKLGVALAGTLLAELAPNIPVGAGALEPNGLAGGGPVAAGWGFPKGELAAALAAGAAPKTKGAGLDALAGRSLLLPNVKGLDVGLGAEDVEPNVNVGGAVVGVDEPPALPVEVGFEGV